MQTIKEAQAAYEVSTPLETVLTQALRLSPIQKVRLVERLMGMLETELGNGATTNAQPPPRRSLFGVLAHLGAAPSAEEIDEARRAAWATFPREDI